ncbi:hypothetical protein D3C80_760440 [compost metagenome]
MAAVINDRNGQQVVLTEQTRDILAIRMWRDRDRIIITSKRQDRLVQLTNDQTAQTDDTQQNAALWINHIDCVNSLTRALDLADMIERLPDIPIGRHSDEFDGHQATSRVRRIAHELLQRGLGFRRKNGKQTCTVGIFQFLKDVGCTVSRHTIEQQAGGIWRKRCQNFGRTFQFRLVEQADGIFVRKLGDNGYCVIGIQLIDDLDRVARTNIGEAAGNCCSREVGNIEHFRDEVVVGHRLAFPSIRRRRQTVQADPKRSDHELP